MRQTDQLQPLIAAPSLEARFLTRPPFRLIHQVVMGLIEYQNFPAELFVEQELDINNFKVLAGEQSPPSVFMFASLLLAREHG